MKPEAVKVVSEVINAYKNSVCYKVGEALDAKRKEMEKSNSTFKKTWVSKGKRKLILYGFLQKCNKRTLVQIKCLKIPFWSHKFYPSKLLPTSPCMLHREQLVHKPRPQLLSRQLLQIQSVKLFSKMDSKILQIVKVISKTKGLVRIRRWINLHKRNLQIQVCIIN